MPRRATRDRLGDIGDSADQEQDADEIGDRDRCERGRMIAMAPSTTETMPAVSSNFQFFERAAFNSGGTPGMAVDMIPPIGCCSEL